MFVLFLPEEQSSKWEKSRHASDKLLSPIPAEVTIRGQEEIARQLQTEVQVRCRRKNRNKIRISGSPEK